MFIQFILLINMKGSFYMKNKKIVIGVIIGIILIVAIIGIVLTLNSDKTNPEDTLKKYISLINEKQYDEMYELISEESKSEINKEDFIKRNSNIYEGIESSNLKIEIQEINKEGRNITISYNESMNTSVGDINFSNKVNLIKEDKEYKIKWSSSLIFPELRNSEKIRIKTNHAKRGSILDRNGKDLAADGVASSIGIVPGKLGDNKEENIEKISQLTGVSTETINKYLSASYVKDDTFVPIKKVAKSETELKEKLLQISGIKITDTDARVYNLGEEAAHLIGYVQPINAEELEENKDKGYTTNSLIGKTGLEKVYEDRLKGTDGGEIYIEDEDGNKLKTLVKKEVKDGEDIKLTIDSNLQKSLYDQLKEDKGFFVVMEPKNGELLALVSTPSFNSNDFTLGMTNEKWNELSNDENKPLYNRFARKILPRIYI